VAAASVDIWVENANGSGVSLTYSNGGNALWSASDGGFSVQATEGTYVVALASKAGFVQPCGAVLQVKDSNAPLELELVRIAAVTGAQAYVPAAAASAVTVTGFVYEMQGGQRQPVAGAMVWLSTYYDVLYGTTRTAADGRFVACALPNPFGRYAGKTVLAVSKDDYLPAERADIDTTQSSSIDLEMKRR
jgi:hypothetical protein